MIALADHSTISQVNASIIGLSSIRARGSDTFFIDSAFDRQRFLDGIVENVQIVADAFPNKQIYTGFWEVDDLISDPSLTSEIIRVFDQEFNGDSRQRLGFFQENLACETPVTSFATPLASENDTRPILFQMLQGWTTPFSNPERTDICLSDAEGPNVGMQYALDTYNSRYFEIYIGDIDHIPFWPVFQEWHDALEASLTPFEN